MASPEEDPKEVKIISATSRKFIYYYGIINGWLVPIKRVIKNTSKYMPHQGKRECERRLRQESRHAR